MHWKASRRHKAMSPGDVALARSLSRFERERRTSGLVRVPFVRRCHIDLDHGGITGTAFMVNINVLGAYVALDDPSHRRSPDALTVMPDTGQWVRCRFGRPGTDRAMALTGAVAWVRERQQHRVHSLPPGFGIQFTPLADAERAWIENLIVDYETLQEGRFR